MVLFLWKSVRFAVNDGIQFVVIFFILLSHSHPLMDGKSSTQAYKLDTCVFSRPPYFTLPEYSQSHIYQTDHTKKMLEQ